MGSWETYSLLYVCDVNDVISLTSALLYLMFYYINKHSMKTDL